LIHQIHIINCEDKLQGLDLSSPHFNYTNLYVNLINHIPKNKVGLMNQIPTHDKSNPCKSESYT